MRGRDHTHSPAVTERLTRRGTIDRSTSRTDRPAEPVPATSLTRPEDRPADKEWVIPPPPVDPDTSEPRPTRPDAGTAPGPGGTTPVTPEPDHHVDEDELDERWGFGPSQPLVGHGAPPVVAVVVTRDPGDWFDDTLRSLGEQDYGDLSVLVIDNGSEVDPTPRIAEVLPTAYVKRLEEDRGFSAAANDSLTAVEGSAFHLILHDDVRLAPDAVTHLVSEAFRVNAGVVGPKLVDWDDPSRLVSAGISVDTYGHATEIVEAGELDQSQHDTAREVFALSDACLLVRSDLFRTLGGFSEDIPFFGEDVDLCWRAHVAAATVRLCPSAVAAHRNRFAERRPVEDRERLELRHEARSTFTNYEPFRVLRLLPAVVVLSLVDLVGSLVVGRARRAGDVVASWLWNLVKLPSLVRARSRVKRIRRAHDADYLPLMRKGSARLISLVRPEDGENRLHSAAEAGRGYLRELASGSQRGGVWLALATIFLVLVGVRDLFTGPLPVVRELIDPGESPGRLLSEWWTGWRAAGFGESSLPPAVVPGLGLAGAVLGGSLGLARRILVIAPLLVGALGAWKLFVRSESTRVRSAALVVYALNPVVLNAVAEGRLGAIVTYGAAPWVLRRTARAAGAAPFSTPEDEPASALRAAAGTALVLFAVAAVTPLGAGILVASVALLSIAPLAAGDRPAALRMVRGAGLSGLLAAVPTLPWLVSAVRAGDGSSLTGLWHGAGAVPSAAELVTGDLGPVAVGAFGWGVVVAAGYSLLAGRGWRAGWAYASWTLAFVGWGAAVLLGRADLLAGAGAELVLVPAVLAMALATAMGAAAFEHDVVGSDFGATQILSGVAVVALLLSIAPVGVAAANGRWYQPEGDFRRVLRLVDEGEGFRTVWLGDPDLLPLAGWSLDEVDGVSVGVSSGLDPTVTERYHLDGGDGVDALQSAIDAALRGETTRLGRMLAPMGVRYLVAVDRAAPEPFAARETPLPDGAVGALREQLDLSEIDLNPGLVMFEVADTWPLRSDLQGTELPEGSDDLAQLLHAPLDPPEPVLSAGAGPRTRVSGRLDQGAEVAQSVEHDPAWSLDVDGESVAPDRLLGWAQRYDATDGGQATLGWGTPTSTRALQAVQLLGLVGLVLLARRRRRTATHVGRRRRGRGTDAPVVVVGTGDDEGSEVDAARAAAGQEGGAS